MFTTFPTKPIPHSPRSSPRSSRQSRHPHRSAVIYGSHVNILPARPEPVRTQPERPVPVVLLPGLPSRLLPKSVVGSGPKGWAQVSKKWVSNESYSQVELIFSKSWLVRFLPLIKKPQDILRPIYTPRTATFVNANQDYKDLRDFDHTLKDDSYDFKPTPPPLYLKGPPEGGLVGWLTVAGA